MNLYETIKICWKCESLNIIVNVNMFFNSSIIIVNKNEKKIISLYKLNFYNEMI